MPVHVPEEADALRMRMDLVQVLHGFTFTIAMACGKCNTHPTRAELYARYDENPNHGYLLCVRCKRDTPVTLTAKQAKKPRYTCQIIGKLDITIALFAQRKELTRLSCKKFSDVVGPQFYYSLLFHFGGIRAALRTCGISQYRFNPRFRTANTRPIVARFLGKVPDEFLAGALGRDPRKVTELRTDAGIPALSP